jgi:hypothetical protein
MPSQRRVRDIAPTGFPPGRQSKPARDDDGNRDGRSSAIGRDAGANLAAGVTLVQTSLNRIVGLSGTPALPVSGTCDAATVDAIRNFQFRLVNLFKPDGKIDPDRRSWKKLIALAALPDPPPISATQTPRRRRNRIRGSAARHGSL